MLRATTPSPLGSAPRGRPLPAGSATALCRVAFCGPIAAAGKPAGGGYEAANRRTCDSLVRRGLRVIELPYPKPGGSAVMKLLGYAASFTKAACYLLTQRKHYDLVHLTPLNMHFAWAETLLASCARLAGKPLLVDIRAGTFVRHYQSSSALYRRAIDRTLRLASQVSVEGQEYIPFVRQRTRRPVFYFPNYVDSPALNRAPPERSLSDNGPTKLIYFGRLVSEKGIETALNTLALLAERGHHAQLEFIGGGAAAYVAEMQQRYAHLPVTWTPSLPVDQILQRAGQAHFFFFASRHDGEGHSNALNEAMSVGLVPVCSAQGFTRAVVGNAGVVLPRNAQPPEYAAAIEAIVLNRRWAKYSQRARTRVRTLYSEEAAVPALIEVYRRMQLKR